MGFFSSIGNAVKGLTKMVSVKNIAKVASGDYSGLGKEALGRVMKGVASTSKAVDIVNSQGGQMAAQAMDNELAKVSPMLRNAVAGSSVGQSLAKFGTKLWFSTMWQKYKTWILAGGAVLVAFLVYWFGFRKKKPSYGRRR